MVFVIKEKQARTIFKKYNNVVAFTTGKSKGIDDDELSISYGKLNFLPDEDQINEILSSAMGAKKTKKVIEKMVGKMIETSTKEIKKPNLENYEICTGMAQIINMLCPDKDVEHDDKRKKSKKKSKKRGPVVAVFVLEDTDGAEADLIKARNKIMTTYIEGIFKTFGVQVITEDNAKKIIKKVFDGKRKKVPEKVTTFIKNNPQVTVSSKGKSLKKLLFTYYSIELMQTALSGLDIEEMPKKFVQKILKTLIDTYTNDNLCIAAGMKKKKVEKIAKRLKAKNKMAVEAYNDFVEILKAVNPDIDMPKVKNGYPKKGKKKDEPKMNVDKFIKFFTKKKGKNLGILMMLYGHTAAVLAGAGPDSKEYSKLMTTIIGQVGAEADFSKAYVNAAKAWVKAG